ncbi:hypothetical protein BH09BAC3_BH09BAC3_28950 [soil metagenome]
MLYSVVDEKNANRWCAADLPRLPHKLNFITVPGLRDALVTFVLNL